VIIPVFKTGVSRVLPGSGRFDSDTLPPFIFNRLQWLLDPDVLLDTGMLFHRV